MYAILNLNENVEDYEMIQSYDDEDVIEFVNGYFDENILNIDCAIKYLNSMDFKVIPIV